MVAHDDIILLEYGGAWISWMIIMIMFAFYTCRIFPKVLKLFGACPTLLWWYVME